MNLLTFCLLFAIASLACASVEYDTSKGWYVPKMQGGFDWVTMEQYEAECKQRQSVTVNVKFYLYTNSKPSTPEQLELNDASNLLSSNFNKTNPTRFIIHGWQSSAEESLNVNIRSALFEKGLYNVFSVDWSSHTSSWNYNSSRSVVPDVGQVVANFIDFLSRSGGMSFSTLTLYGHSLGAHVCGYAGKRVSRGRINTIIAMDAAVPLFSIGDCSTRLCKNDADYVESIHTNAGLLGFLEAVGHADFYPNGGRAQPGCGLDMFCSHSRAHIYVAEGIKMNSFFSMACSSYPSAVGNSKCGSTISSVKMASPSNFGISGYFYTPVNSGSPFGKSIKNV